MLLQLLELTGSKLNALVGYGRRQKVDKVDKVDTFYKPPIRKSKNENTL